MTGLGPLIAYAAALAVAAVIPGPGVAALVGQSLGGGLRAALFFLAGLVLGDLVYLTIAVAGLAALAQVFAGAFLVVKVLGGLYLVYLGVAFWKARAGLTQIDRSERRGGGRSFLSGFTVTLGNPKTIVFYLALVPTVIDLDTVGPAQWGLMVLVSVLVLITVLSPYAVLAARARGVMARTGALNRLNRIAGAVIGAAGVLILGEALRGVLRRA